MNSNPILSTPAQVRAMADMMTKLAAPPQGIVVQDYSGSWQTPANKPVDLAQCKEDEAQPFALLYGDLGAKALNVASLAILAPDYPPLMRAYTMYCAAFGDTGLDQFKGLIVNYFTAEVEKLLTVAKPAPVKPAPVVTGVPGLPIGDGKYAVLVNDQSPDLQKFTAPDGSEYVKHVTSPFSNASGYWLKVHEV